MRKNEHPSQSQSSRIEIQKDREISRQDFFPQKTELESPAVLYAFLLETSSVWDDFWKQHEKDRNKYTDTDGCSVFPEVVMDKVFERYSWLAKQNPIVTIYHQTTMEGLSQILDEKTGEMTLLSGNIHKFNGQGIYFGLSEPFNWIQEDIGGATFVAEVQINQGYPSLSGNARRPMFMLPRLFVNSVADYDPIETVRGTRLSRDWKRKSESILIHRDDQKSLDKDIKPGLKHYYFDCRDEGHDSDIWWKMDDEYYGPLNRLHPNEADLKYIDKTLGLIGTEQVEYDEDISALHTRIYVEEDNPLLVSCVAQMVSATEIVYGKPGSRGRKMIDEYKQGQAGKQQAA
jgi:hypothetical protein